MNSVVLLVAVAGTKLCTHSASSFAPPSPLSSVSLNSRPTSFTFSVSGSSLHKKSLYNCHCQCPSLHHASRLYSNEMSNNELVKNLLINDAPDDNDPYSRFTHQIAIPLQDASELHSALHAIQTSLVRDCPRLIRACVMPALLRMPLLYVDGSSLEKGNVVGANESVDTILEEVVNRAIRDVVYGEDEERSGTSSANASLSGDPKEESVKPILLPFRGLELQGEDNSVLYAVGNNVNDESDDQQNTDQSFGDEDDDGVFVVDDWSAATSPEENCPSGWEILEQLVLNVQNELESKYGLETCWPLDKPQGEEIVYDDPLVAAIKKNQRKWRPRVPFVRLPKDFYQVLKDDFEKRNSEGDSDEDEPPSIIDMGFDGISPLFWYEAWGGEDILPPPGVRMQAVAVYRRMVPGGGEAETSFYVPTSSSGPKGWKSGANAVTVAGSANYEKGSNSMEFPVGDAKLMARERREKAKAMDRLGEVEQRAEREWEEGKARWMEETSGQGQYGNGETRSSLDEDSLAQFDVGMEMGEVTVDGDAAYSTPWSERDADVPEQAKEIIPDEEPLASTEIIPPVDSEEIQSDSPSMSQPSDTEPRRELPSIADNPVFQRLWKGQLQETSQGQNTALALEGTPPTSDEPLPPYPSDGHFVGAWRVVSSPMDTSIDIESTESKSSDNFILRVDGQVMGGPVLDAQYQHKAAGGKWKMFQAVRKALNKSESDKESPPVTQTRLRIQLLVPPEKDRVLVMEGEVTRLVMPGTGDATPSSSDGWMIPSGGMLDGMLQNINDVQSEQETKTGEGLLCCAGEAWMEDVGGGANRRKLGSFSLMKLKAIKTENLIYTVDVSRSLSEEKDNE